MDAPVEDGAGAGERVTFSSIYNTVHKAVTTTAAVRKDVDPQMQVGAGIKADDEDDPIPSPNSPLDNTEACAQSSLFESLLPPPFSTAATSNPVPIATTSANPKRSIIVGSHDSSRMHNLAESTTWEKIEGINDEWQELSNPREDVLAMSESDDEELDEDDEEWEASRKVNTMADSAFLPSVERRRRLAAAQLKKQGHGDIEGAGSATPRGKRTPTTSFAKPLRGGACAYEAYNPNGTPPPPSRAAPPSTPAASKLTPQQEQLVAELQRARTTRGVAMPLVPQHQQMNRRVVPLSSDW